MNQPAELLPQFSTIEYVVQVRHTGVFTYVYSETGDNHVCCVFLAWSSDAIGFPVCGGHLYGR